MILNNLGNASVGDDKLVKFTEQSVMDWEVKSSNGDVLAGSLGSSQYTEVTPPGGGPWKVRMGSSGFSRSATADGITAKDATISCLIVFPIGPNDAHLFIDERKS